MLRLMIDYFHLNENPFKIFIFHCFICNTSLKDCGKGFYINKVQSLYIHFPFCRHLCNYCDFHKSVIDDQKVKPLQAIA